MSRIRVLSAIWLLIVASGASASSFLVTTDNLVDAMNESSHGTSHLSESLHNDKIVRDAHDDAASFVASNGVIRGAQLEGALQRIHQRFPQLVASDAQLAQAILTL